MIGKLQAYVVGFLTRIVQPSFYGGLQSAVPGAACVHPGKNVFGQPFGDQQVLQENGIEGDIVTQAFIGPQAPVSQFNVPPAFRPEGGVDQTFRHQGLLQGGSREAMSCRCIAPQVLPVPEGDPHAGRENGTVAVRSPLVQGVLAEEGGNTVLQEVEV